jgi:hypothetical protein
LRIPLLTGERPVGAQKLTSNAAKNMRHTRIDFILEPPGLSTPRLLMLQALNDNLRGDRGANECVAYGPEKHSVDLQPG